MQGAGLLSNSSRSRISSEVVQGVIDHLGFVQIDTINTIVRAHHHILHTRLDHYRPVHLKPLLEEDRSCFEHWTHDASIISEKYLQEWRVRFARYAKQGGKTAWWKARMGGEARKIMREVRRRIEREGPLMSRDFGPRNSAGKLSGSTGEGTGGEAGGGWWKWKPHKAALEYMWRCGELAVAKRINFQKCYDFAERIFPDLNHLPLLSDEEYVDWACRFALERITIATPSEISGFLNAINLAEARSWCRKAVNRGEIIPVLVDSADGSPPRPAFALADWEARAANLSNPPRRTRLLSPFDPLIRDRQRAFRLFNFDYRFEAFVPAVKRVYGYYVLPILEQDMLTGRLDSRFERKTGRLEVLGVWWEPNRNPGKSRVSALQGAIRRFSRLIGAKEIVRIEGRFKKT